MTKYKKVYLYTQVSNVGGAVVINFVFCCFFRSLERRPRKQILVDVYRNRNGFQHRRTEKSYRPRRFDKLLYRVNELDMIAGHRITFMS